MELIAACVNLKYLQNTSLYMEYFSSGSKQKSEKINYKLLLITGLKKEIEMARKLDPEKFAAEIRKTGFFCQQCGKCCRRAFGDNRVVLTPSEIEKIRDYTGLSKLEVAGPFISETSIQDELEEEKENSKEGFFGASENNENILSETPEFLELLREDIDYEGNIHAFGWMLRRKRNSDCIFLEKGTSRCRTYPVRPMLCRTYPFYIEELSLHTCECEGLGHHISAEDSKKLAENLLYRYLSELEDMLSMYEKFEDFRREEKGMELAKKSLEKGTFTYIVHDSTGITKIIE
ncbi:MAG: YkgJ family cysteine cluster protein [Methanosarcina sp.]